MSLLGKIFGRRAAAASPPELDDDAALARLAPWRQRNVRVAWRPRTEDRDGDALASKFCGAAWLAPGEAWPACGCCGSAMPLFLQLDLAAAAAATGLPLGEGLLQLFYCVADDCAADGWEPFGSGKLVRIVPAGAPGRAGTPPAVPASEPLQPRLVTGWEPAEDLPSAEEAEALGLAVDWHRGGKRVTVRWPEGGVEVDASSDTLLEKLANPLGGDKLGGWPNWVQGVEYPSCPRCGKSMELVFQVDSFDHVGWMFGDTGCGHVTRCPDHPDVVAFGWACC